MNFINPVPKLSLLFGALFASTLSLGYAAPAPDAEPSQFFQCISKTSTGLDAPAAQVLEAPGGAVFLYVGDQVVKVPMRKELGSETDWDHSGYDPYEDPSNSFEVYRRSVRVGGKKYFIELSSRGPLTVENESQHAAIDKQRADRFYGTRKFVEIPEKSVQNLHKTGETWGDESRKVLEERTAQALKEHQKSPRCTINTASCVEEMKKYCSLNTRFTDVELSKQIRSAETALGEAGSKAPAAPGKAAPVGSLK